MFVTTESLQEESKNIPDNLKVWYLYNVINLVHPTNAYPSCILGATILIVLFQVLFRPVAMANPDFSLIGEVMLCSQGFDVELSR